MNYIVFRQRNKGIPTILALVLVIAIAFGVALFVRNKPDFRVAFDTADVNLETSIVGNIRDNNISLFWKTSEPTVGYVVYGSDIDNLSNEVFDVRDTSGEQIERIDHYVTFDDVKANETYYYYIIANGKKIGQSAAMPFTVDSGKSVNGLFAQEQLYGSIRRQNRQAFGNTVIVATIDGAEPLMTVTKSDGSYTLGPCCLKKGSRSEVFVPDEEADVKLEAYSEDEIESSVYSFISLKSGNEVVLGEPVVADNTNTEIVGEDFILQEEFLQTADLVETIADVDIIYPKEDASIPDTKPLYKGVGEPGTEVRGRIEPDGKLFKTAVTEDGVWTYIPSTGLNPGRHSLTVQTVDKSGEQVALIREFTVLKSGEAVLGESTPSATLTPEASVSPTETPETSPTTAPTIAPTEPVTQPTIPSGVPTKPPPVPGSNILPFASLSVVIIMIGMAVYLFN